jgi:hypothetical protein
MGLTPFGFIGIRLSGWLNMIQFNERCLTFPRCELLSGLQSLIEHERRVHSGKEQQVKTQGLINSLMRHTNMGASGGHFEKGRWVEDGVSEPLTQGGMILRIDCVMR